jgi:hypothetical protein
LVTQDAEQEEVIVAIRKLDKHTLNMYTALRAGLGTRALSWIRLDFRGYGRTEMAREFRRKGSNEQDHWN